MGVITTVRLRLHKLIGVAVMPLLLTLACWYGRTHFIFSYTDVDMKHVHETYLVMDEVKGLNTHIDHYLALRHHTSKSSHISIETEDGVKFLLHVLAH